MENGCKIDSLSDLLMRSFFLRLVRYLRLFKYNGRISPRMLANGSPGKRILKDILFWSRLKREMQASQSKSRQVSPGGNETELCGSGCQRREYQKLASRIFFAQISKQNDEMRSARNVRALVLSRMKSRIM